MEKIKKNWPIVILLIAIAGCMFILNISTLLSPDDYSYGILIGGDDLKVTSLSQIGKAVSYLYVSWTGRIIPHILVGLFVLKNTIILKILNPILFVTLIVFLNRFITRKNTYLSMIMAFGFFVYGTMFGEKFAWISRKFKLFMDKCGFNGIFVQHIWIFCGKPYIKKVAEDYIINMWIICRFFT